MAQTYPVTEVTARILPETAMHPDIVDPMPTYPEYRGTFGAKLVSGPFTLQFNYGYDSPETILAGIDNLRRGLDALEARVRQAAAAAALPEGVVAIPLAEAAEGELRAVYGNR